jgi:DNA-binding TFAR19-related protein (PDSD5 family)
VLEVAKEEERDGQQAELRKQVYRRLREMQVEQQKKAVAQRMMTPGAYERLMNVRVSNFQLYTQLLDFIFASAQQNRAAGRITEGQLREILARLTYRPETRIEFRHK